MPFCVLSATVRPKIGTVESNSSVGDLVFYYYRKDKDIMGFCQVFSAKLGKLSSNFIAMIKIRTPSTDSFIDVSKLIKLKPGNTE